MKSNHIHRHSVAALFAAAALVVIPWSGTARADSPSFMDDVMPILADHCLECHVPGGEGYEKSGLDMRTYESLMKGTKHGPVIVPGDAFTSNFNALVEGRSRMEVRMPFHRKEISRWERVILRRWVNRGAKNN